MTNLLVPYTSQWDPEASKSRDDCGPTCIKMILKYYGEDHPVDEIFTKTGATTDSLITIGQMQTAINAYGFRSEYLKGQTPDKIKALTDSGIPPILLIHYDDLKSKQDTDKGGHFLVDVGWREDGYFINDPDFWSSHRAEGDHHFYTKSELEASWANATKDGNPANSMLVIYPKVPPAAPANGVWIKDYLSAKGIDITNEGDARAKLGDIFDEAAKYDQTNADKVKAQNDLQAANGRVTEVETENKHLKGDLTQAQNDLIDSKSTTVDRDITISQLKAQLAAAGQPVPPTTPPTPSHSWLDLLIKWLSGGR